MTLLLQSSSEALVAEDLCGLKFHSGSADSDFSHMGEGPKGKMKAV